jgi:hypothetical protein
MRLELGRTVRLGFRRLADFPLPDADYPGLAWNPGGGEVELRPGSVVTSADGRLLGRVTGVLAADHDRITHLVLRRRLVRRPRDLTLPIHAVERVDSDVVTLRLTRRQVDRRS